MSPEGFCKSETAAQFLDAYGIMIIIIYLIPETPPGKPASQSEHLWFTLILLHSIFDPYLAQLMVVRTASMSYLGPNLFQHTWNQTCDPEVTGSPAVLLLSSATLGEKQNWNMCPASTVQLHIYHSFL